MREAPGFAKDSGTQPLKSPLLKKAEDVSPGGTQRPDKISVPWSWSRIVNLEGQVVYLR